MRNDDPEDISLVEQLSEASSRGDLERAKAVLEQWKARGNGSLRGLQSALYSAASNKQALAVSYLLEQGLYINMEALSNAVRSKATDVLQVYLDHGWDINQHIGLGKGPGLLMGSVLNDQDLLTWFLAHGASPNAPGDRSVTGLDLAGAISSPNVIEQLLQHGGTINCTNALHMAARSPKSGRRQVVEYLLEAGTDINVIEYTGSERFSFHAERGAGTPLHNAARYGRENMVKFLLEKGADPEVRDTLGRTPAELAKEQGHPELVPLLSIVKKV